MRVKFWGVRGSTPRPGSATVRYGGNTACVELLVESLDRRLIIDAGSGIRELGDEMMRSHTSQDGLRAEIFLSHTHWDHIMGFPFFSPIYLPEAQLKIYGPVTYEEATLKEVLSGQWTYRHFPVRHDELSAHIEYVDLKEGEYELGDGLKLTTKYLNHPLLCLGYRFEYSGRTICTAFDTEPFHNLFCISSDHSSYDAAMAAEGEKVAADENARIETFISGADLLIYDAQYTRAEYEATRKGWGHSPIEHAIETAGRCGVKRLALFHHDIQRTDDDIDALALRYEQQDYRNGTEVFFAREGMVIHI
jgi:phosphoribosyl 1,2-cyclic phosphodiesterase